MDDPFCFRALYSVSIYMGHNVMPDQRFPFLRHLIINILCMLFQFGNLFVRYIQSQLLFRFRKGNP